MIGTILKTGAPVFIILSGMIASIAADENSEKLSSGQQSKEFVVKVDVVKNLVRISTRGKSGYHCNTLYPWKLTVEDTSTTKKIYRKKDARKFTKQEVVFEVPHIKGQQAAMKISVCNDVQCIMHEAKLSW